MIAQKTIYMTSISYTIDVIDTVVRGVSAGTFLLSHSKIIYLDYVLVKINFTYSQLFYKTLLSLIGDLYYCFRNILR